MWLCSKHLMLSLSSSFPSFTTRPGPQLSFPSSLGVLGDKGPSQNPPTPSQPSPGLREELGKRPWRADRRCPACPLPERVLIPQRPHERTDCSVTEPWVYWEVRACRAPAAMWAKPHCVGPTGAETPVNEDPVSGNKLRHWWNPNGEENGAVSSSTDFPLASTVLLASCFFASQSQLVW